MYWLEVMTFKVMEMNPGEEQHIVLDDILGSSG
jgi:hypothetical protein